MDSKINKLKIDINNYESKITECRSQLKIYERQKSNESKINSIKKYFDEYTKDKHFSKEHVEFLPVFSDSSTKAKYDYDGVYIYYFTRQSCHLGDYDTFLDILVKVDGEVVYEKDWM